MQFSTSTFLFLSSLALSSVSASPNAFKRNVGPVRCEPVRTGSLALTDLDGNVSYATLSTEIIQDFSGANATFLTTKINGVPVTSDQSAFDFAKCTSNYMGYQAEVPIGANRTSKAYYGHVSPATPEQNSRHCLTLSTGNPQASSSLFAASVCNFNDNQSQEWNFFGLSDGSDSLFFLGSNNGTKPTDRYVAVDSITGRVSINTGSAPAGPNGTYFMSLPL